MVKFTFNKKARAAAAAAIKKLETGSFIGAVLGAFGASPQITAIAALAVFLVCRIAETLIAGIEDHQSSARDGELKPTRTSADDDAHDSDA
ncbi:hypothetical protein [Massilia sp. TS11]|uniref:hypothetical protein n=1 Tax=Massilia sp. TS11 TaxID=2908003 RepID=UPI001EDAEF50|nr:hypothetical protein [Massilia sp. TS11]MCG2583865.1 hypothetical protein [Massilia sp. TS11]